MRYLASHIMILRNVDNVEMIIDKRGKNASNDKNFGERKQNVEI